MEKKGIGRVKRRLLLALQHFMAVTAAVCAALIVQNAYYVLETEHTTTSTVMYPWEVGDSFEDSYLFTSYLRDNISSIARMSVIKNQLETDGVYDGRKQIDIYEYVNRKNDRQFLPDVHAKYYLEDLIKWNEYGFTYADHSPWYTEVEEAWEEQPESRNAEAAEAVEEAAQNAAFKVLITDSASTESEEAYLTQDSLDTAVESSASETVIADDAGVDYTQTSLVERYRTADGRSILSFVDTPEDYAEYVGVLREAAQQLALNYAEYKYLNENYGSDKTNLRYCIQVPTASGNEYFTNENIDGIRQNIMEHFRNYGRYLYYYPEHMEFETNTGFTEDYIRSVFGTYEYTYPENTKIWFAVDTGYPVHDSLYQNRLQYRQFMPYYILCLGVMAAAVLMYGVLWIYLTIKEGRTCKIAETGEESRIILNDFDRIPSEFVLLLAGIVGGIVWLLCNIIAYLVWHKLSAELFIGLCAATALLLSVCGMLFYYSLVRRLKAHALLKNTLCIRLLCRIVRRLGAGLRRVQKSLAVLSADSSVLVRTWVPYVLFLIANLLLLLWAAVTIDRGILVCIPALLLIVLNIGVGVLQFRKNRTRKRIVEGIVEITKGDIRYQIPTEEMDGDNLVLAQAVNSIGDGIRAAVETSMKDERLKADLITNVSHDIKTPLTSIINYVDLLKRENIQDEKIKGYIEVLDGKSQRLKQLTEDLVEASKISSGNIVYQFERIDFMELVHQTLGEFSEKFEEKNLSVIARFPEDSMPIQADSRRIWRVIENLYNNIYKYAMPGTRVYMDVTRETQDDLEYVAFSVKNISAQPLNINADELTERFIRGDVSRSTEGSGLGLSIAKNLTQAQHGSFTIYLDGDLFKVIIRFPLDE